MDPTGPGFDPSTTINGGLINNTGISQTVQFSILSNNGCANIPVASVNVLAPPNAGVISGPTSVCQNNSITLSSSVGGGVWSSNNPDVTVNPGTGQVTASSTANGSATITYTVTSGGCSNSVNYPISVNPAPTGVNAYLNGTVGLKTTTICSGGSVTLATQGLLRGRVLCQQPIA